MTIRFNCSDCGKDYKVPDRYAGKKVKCKGCGATIRVPAEGEEKAKTSSKKSKRVSATSAKAEKATSTRTKKKRSKASTKVLKVTSNGTEIIEVPDLAKEKKVYESKKKEEKKHTRGAGRLVYFHDGKAKKSFRLDANTRVIGSDSGCEVHIDDASVSKKHCKIEVRLGKFIMTDLKSSNGLLVNHKKVRRSALNNGDIIQLGRAVLRIDCG